MTVTIIIIICVLLLLAYVFDISASKTKIPSVILLLLLGFLFKQITLYFQIEVPDLNFLLPILGTVGLILIVLEGSLELEYNKSKIPLIRKSMLVALLPMLIFSAIFAALFSHFGNISFQAGLANAIPFAVVSSAIAIPSAQNLSDSNREFVTYESSLSDIFGVIFFNFITLNEVITFGSFTKFTFEIMLMLVITVIATLGLAFLLSKIKHHVKYAPIILIIILIYAITKIYHLPGLLFILLFGLSLGNLDVFKDVSFIKLLKPEILEEEVHKFRELVIEMAFLVRALFFLLFGFLINLNELLNVDAVVWTMGILATIYILRFIFLTLFKINLNPILYIAPRGLITILLFLNIPERQSVNLVNNSLTIQVILLTAIVMMFGLMFQKKEITE
ncbi:MAG TPA: hypothetical protein PKO18_05980 [Chitinophagales bacterium]|nr:hypothetical protein [Chitinophagales bacterium]HNL84765.1 hypothetical protein [Chitinophagales bacterium]